MKKNTKPRRLLALFLALTLALGMIPLSASAASQENIYHDPAENWLEGGDRANTFTQNATRTYGTMQCRYCTIEPGTKRQREPALRLHLLHHLPGAGVHLYRRVRRCTEQRLLRRLHHHRGDSQRELPVSQRRRHLHRLSLVKKYVTAVRADQHQLSH